jgi:hypothetical protein
MHAVRAIAFDHCDQTVQSIARKKGAFERNALERFSVFILSLYLPKRLPRARAGEQ